MAKFPSQRKMLYQTGALSNDTYTILTSGGVAGGLNLPKDLSLMNRRGYASTTRKGVPLVYRAKIDFFPQDEDGQGPGTAMGSDFQATLKIDGVQNNWVMKNAAIKWHAAYQKMYRDAGVKKKDLGAYAHEIRYNYDAASSAWLVPIDGDGAAFTGGTWDDTTLSWAGVAGFTLKLIGNGDNEEADAFGGTVVNLAHSYLVSRVNQQADTNLHTEEGPAKFSVLADMLSPSSFAPTSVTDDVVEDARDNQDNPPYEVLDLSDSGDISHDITEPVELGRAVCGQGYGHGSVIVDIPFGIAGMKATVYDANDTNVTPSLLVSVEVLDIFEMQG